MIHETSATNPDPLLQRASGQRAGPSDLHCAVGNWAPRSRACPRPRTDRQTFDSNQALVPIQFERSSGRFQKMYPA